MIFDLRDILFTYSLTISSSLLYRAMSFLKVLTIIIVKIPEKKVQLVECVEVIANISIHRWCIYVNWIKIILRDKKIGFHTRQKDDNHHRVDDGEPVNLHVTHGQVDVPSWCPTNVTVFPKHIVCVENLIFTYNAGTWKWLKLNVIELHV